MSAAIRAHLFVDDKRERAASRPTSAPVKRTPTRQYASPASTPLVSLDDSESHRQPIGAAADPYKSAGRLIRWIEGDWPSVCAVASVEKVAVFGQQLWVALPKVKAWAFRADLEVSGPSCATAPSGQEFLIADTN